MCLMLNAVGCDGKIGDLGKHAVDLDGIADRQAAAVRRHAVIDPFRSKRIDEWAHGAHKHRNRAAHQKGESPEKSASGKRNKIAFALLENDLRRVGFIAADGNAAILADMYAHGCVVAAVADVKPVAFGYLAVAKRTFGHIFDLFGAVGQGGKRVKRAFREAFREAPLRKSLPTDKRPETRLHCPARRVGRACKGGRRTANPIRRKRRFRRKCWKKHSRGKIMIAEIFIA